MKRLKTWAAKINIPAWLFMLCAVLFDELMLHFWTPRELQLGRLCTVIVCAAFFGLLAALPTAIGRSARLSRILALVLSSVAAILSLTAFFIQNAFKSFMLPKDILDNAGHVAEGFGDTLAALLTQGAWRIVVLLLPIVLYGILGHLGKWGSAKRRLTPVVLAGVMVVSFFASKLCIRTISPDTKKFNEEYSFDGAVRSFGLSEALLLELCGAGNSKAEFIDVPTAAPTETVPATEATETFIEATEPPVEYGLHEFDIDYAALAENEWDERIASAHRYVASQTPASENEYTGLFAGKNLILITAEAFSKEVIDPVRTPTLYRMAHEGIYFTDYYQPAWGGSTSTGEFSCIYGVVPTSCAASIKKTIGNNNSLTIGNQLRKQGYFSIAYHNNDYTYYDRHRTHCGLGYDTYMGMGNGLEEGVQPLWPESDLEMIDFTLPQYIDRQPFSVYYMTVSGHCSYSQDSNDMAAKNYAAVENEDWSERVKCYHAANLELENAMTSLVTALEKAGIADDTVIVISPDHYPYGLEKSYAWTNGEDYLAELYGHPVKSCFDRDQTALIIWSGSIEGMHLQVDAPTMSLDILPTLSNLFGVEYDSRLMVGRDVFSDQMPLVLWTEYSWKTELATYNGVTGEFLPAEGADVGEEYREQIAAIVRNKITFSNVVLDCDYYGILLGKEES